MKQIVIINGPNLNKLGNREPEIYGNVSFEDYLKVLEGLFKEVKFTYFQSNIEGEIVDFIQHTSSFDGLIINPAAYAHTSIAIADALQMIQIPKIEVHISNIFDRENYRQHLISASKCKGVISGLGLDGYRLATLALLN